MILVIVDNVDKMDPVRDTSLQFMDAISEFSKKVYWTTPEQMGWSGGGELSISIPQADCYLFQKSQTGLPSTGVEGEPKSLDQFSAIYMRKEPPVDTRFLAITWMLDRALQLSSSLKVYNNPQVLRSLNEKTSIFEFPDFAREALISSSPDAILQFASAFGQDGIVLKPLDGFGGRGVVHIKPDELNEKRLGEVLSTHPAPVIVQPFDRAVYEGEVRVFCLHGKAVSWCLKVPQKGDFLAGTGAGATIQSYEPTLEEEKVVKHVTNALRKQGVEALGVDMIGGKLSEINITSPRSLFVADQRDEVVGAISQSIKEQLEKIMKDEA